MSSSHLDKNFALPIRSVDHHHHHYASFGFKETMLCIVISVGVSVLTFSVADRIEKWWIKRKPTQRERDIAAISKTTFGDLTSQLQAP